MSGLKKASIGLMFILLVMAVILSGCTSPAVIASPTPTPAVKTDLSVFAAASLTDAFKEMKTAFEATHKDVNVVLNFDGSQALRTQIEQGASADVFASASTSHMTALKNKGMMNNSTITNFVNNKLAVIVPKSNPANITTLADLSKAGVKLVIGGPEVPVGNYTLQIIDKVANDSTYGPEFKTKTLGNVVSRETTVNAVVSKVALGEADAGFVYVSDVPAEYKDKVSIITIPDSLNVIAVYPVGVLSGSNEQANAKAFIDFVKSAEGKAILTKYGFTPI